jgi:hypothetical protein
MITKFVLAFIASVTAAAFLGSELAPYVDTCHFAYCFGGPH